MTEQNGDKRRELRFIRVNEFHHLKLLDRETKALLRYNEWRENHFDKMKRHMTILCYQYPVTKAGARAFKDYMLGVTFKTRELYEQGIEIIRKNAHEATSE